MSDHRTKENSLSAAEAEGAPEGHGVYTGHNGQTRRQLTHIGCECGHIVATRVHHSIDASSDSHLIQPLCAGDLDRVPCPNCGREHRPSIARLVHHPGLRVFALVIPDELSHRELELMADLLLELSKQEADVPRYVRRFTVVHEADALRKLLSASPLTDDDGDALEARQEGSVALGADDFAPREDDLLAREEDLVSKQEDLIAARERLQRERQGLKRWRAELERERAALRALAVDLGFRREAVGDFDQGDPRCGAEKDSELVAALATGDEAVQPLQSEIDRWRASDEPSAAFIHDGQVFLLARPGQRLASFSQHPPRPLVQLHEVGGFPLVVIALLPGSEQVAAADAIYWPLDVRDETVRRMLEGLREAFELNVVLYDEESRAVAGWSIRAPLGENVSYLLQRAQQKLSASTVRPPSFAQVRGAFEKAGNDRLGRRRHGFTGASFADLPSPAATRLALGVIEYWCEAGNEEYLISIKSLPISHWSRVRRRVVERALEFGLRLSDALVNFATDEGLIESRSQLLRALLTQFAAVSQRVIPSDLDPVYELENWQALLADCRRQGVPVEPEVEQLAKESARRARGVTAMVEYEKGPAGDLGTLSTQDLLPLLADRDQRRDAALELCERGTPAVAEAIFAAVRNMSREEAAIVIAAMVQLEGDAVAPLLEGLRHRKSFIRQGCALAIGALAGEEGAVPLVSMMLEEPTRVWNEAARAIGDIGIASIDTIIASAQAADGEGRERLARALAHVALSAEGEEAVRAVLQHEEPVARKVARRALRLLADVRKGDAEVRGRFGTREKTAVRLFTRRFFEALAGEVSELDEQYIVDQEELLGDADILEARQVEDAAGEPDDEGEAPEAGEEMGRPRYAATRTLEISEDDIVSGEAPGTVDGDA